MSQIFQIIMGQELFSFLALNRTEKKSKNEVVRNQGRMMKKERLIENEER
jgi:hypothetical protein